LFNITLELTGKTLRGMWVIGQMNKIAMRIMTEKWGLLQLVWNDYDMR